MGSMTFGRYAPFNTFTHRLDPRTKIILMIMLMIIVFMPFQFVSTSLILIGIYFIIFIGIMLVSKVSFKNLLKSLTAMWFLVLFLAVIYFFLPTTKNLPAFSINGYQFYYDGLVQCAYIVLRLVLMICITMVLTSTTKPLELTYALEWYMAPLKPLHFPVHIIAMMISIALRFIPTILDETERIKKAQESRGVDFSHGGLIKRIKAVISLIIPLFISAFERSEQLADAMEARGYDPNGKRTKYRVLHFHWKDLFSFVIIGSFCGYIMYLSIAHGATLDIVRLITGATESTIF